ncbi:MAG: C13 family peptidase [Candidatus Hermodarchaeota archaeon]
MKKSFRGIFLILVVTFSLFFLGVSLTSTSLSDPASLNKNVKKSKAITEIFGAWIIIAGDRDDHYLVEVLKSGCNKTYEALTGLGFPADNIRYLGPDTSTSQPYVDAESTLTNIRDAIETWAATRVNSTHTLGIYMLSHGGVGTMAIPGTDLTDTDLNTYLDNLEESTGCNRNIIIYEACHSGSFINPVSKDDRIVVTSTDITHSAYVPPSHTWAYFSEAFWSSILACNTIGEAFEDAEANLHAVNLGNSQIPWIDDDHNEIGNEVDALGNLPNGGDGNDALNTRIKPSIACLIPFSIESMPLRTWIPPFDPIPIWVHFGEEIIPQIATVNARITPPGWIPPEPESDAEGTKLTIDTGVALVELTDRDGDGNYTGYYQPSANDTGEFKIDIIARSQDGVLAPIESTGCIRNEDGTKPQDTTPPTIVITSPRMGATVSATINVTTEGDDDQALDKIQIFVNDKMVKEETMPQYYPYPEVLVSVDTWLLENGNHTITAKAIDKAGNSKDVSITVTVHNQLPIPTFGFTTIILGCSLILMSIYIIKKRKKLAKSL